MGAQIELFNPKITDPEKFYNFNLKDDKQSNYHAAKVTGLRPLQGGSLTVDNVRAGATLTLAALIAQGQSIIAGVEKIDRGYEDLDGHLRQLGAEIKRTK